MVYKTVLVQAPMSPAAEPRVRTAAQIAERFGATLVGVVAGAPLHGLVPVAASPAAHNLFGQVEDAWRAARHAAAVRIHEIAEACGCKIEIHDLYEAPAAAMALAASEADLIVASRADPAADDAAGPLSPLVLTCGVPVLIPPDDPRPFSAERIVVAWKDTREARRAVWDALPFLTRASEVTVVALAEDRVDPLVRNGLDEVVERLRRHGAPVEPEVVDWEPGSLSERLLAAAARRRAELLVAGAYGRPRVAEWVFGGVTRDLLRAASCFVLLSR